MKLFYSEGTSDYSKYYFPYQVLGLKEDSDKPRDIYSQGFLPFRSIKGLYYLSRSLRVDLSKYKESSENRRITKKNVDLIFSVSPIQSFNLSEHMNIIHSFISMHADMGNPTDDVFKRLFQKDGNYNYIISAKTNDGRLIGLTAVYKDNNILHYAHPFYDINLKDQNLGMGMMVWAVNECLKEGLHFVYLGTCYGERALYKTQFEGSEFFDGISWNHNLDNLKYLAKNDKEGFNSYSFRDEEYLSRFYGISSVSRLASLIRKNG